MIVFKKSLNRFYNTKTKKIVSKKYAKNHRFTRSLRHKVDTTKKPNYKKKYLQAKHELANRPAIVETQFHPFIAHQTKDGIVTPKKNVNEVKDWMKRHTSNLFGVFALAKNGRFVVRTCGDVNPNEVAGFIQRDLGPELISKYEDGYNE